MDLLTQFKLLVHLNFGVSQYSLQYTNTIGDGDSKAYSAVVDSKPYGDVKIWKSDCAGHVQKCLSTALRNYGRLGAKEVNGMW